MAKKTKAPVVVAELGRPETPAETAARKARDSRLYRQRKTVNNLVFSLIVSVAVVFGIYLMVPHGTGGDFADRSVDVAQLASEASPTAGQLLVAPKLPAGWNAKQAELRSSKTGGITYWYIGYTTPDKQYAAAVQAFTADGAPVNETWIAEQLEKTSATGTQTIGGVDWTAYVHPDRSPDTSNLRTGYQTAVGASTYLVYGTAPTKTIEQLADAVAAQAVQNGAAK